MHPRPPWECCKIPACEVARLAGSDMPRRRRTAIGFVLVTATSLIFSVWAGRKIADTLKDLPLAKERAWTGDYVKDHILPPRNFPPSQLGFFFVSAPIGISLAAGFSFARLWQRRRRSFWIKALLVICFAVLLALSAVNFNWSPDKERDTVLQVWVSGTMALTGILALILSFLAGMPETETEYYAATLVVILLLFQGITLPGCTAVVMGIDTVSTEAILMNGWNGVTSFAFLASISIGLFVMTKTTTLKDKSR